MLAGMDVSSLLSAVIGGLFALAGVVISQRWDQRTRRQERFDELVELTRASAMAVSTGLRAGADDLLMQSLPTFQQHVLSLLAYGSRWRKKHDKAHRGFADTISVLSLALATNQPDIRDRKSVDVYAGLVEATARACTAWEREPARFRAGEIAVEIQQET
jgi:hypothetical protein